MCILFYPARMLLLKLYVSNLAKCFTFYLWCWNGNRRFFWQTNKWLLFAQTPINTLHMMANTNTLRTLGGALRFVSWNVKTKNSPVKRNKVFNHLTHLNTKIAFLQETHLLPSDHLKLRRGWVCQIFHSSFSSKARGVAILIHKSVPFSVTNVVSDINGRYVIITGKIGGHNLILLG